MTTGTVAVTSWRALFDLPRDESSCCRFWPGGGPGKRMFGGHLVAQAMACAAATVTRDAVPASVHSVFLRPADASRPVKYRVEELRTGRAFSTRVIRAEQDDRMVAHTTTQWHRPESWNDHNDAVVPPSLPVETLALPYPAPGVATGLLELRWTDAPGGRGLWFRSRSGALEDERWHALIATYVSDLWLGDAALRRHGLNWGSDRVRASSLDHAVWFHRPVDVTQWNYLGSVSPVADAGRAFVSGGLRTQRGELSMTVQQDLSVRSANGRSKTATSPVGRKQ